MSFVGPADDPHGRAEDGRRAHDGTMTGARAAGPAAPVPWTRYLALGDSFTEGLWDLPADSGGSGGRTAGPGPGDEGRRLRGWADRLAETLSARRVAAGDAPLEYANLAVRGRLVRPIVREQLPLALSFEPDLVSLVAGGNDILRPTVDVDAVSAVIDEAVGRLRAGGADVLLATGFDAAGSPVIELTRGRVGRFNANLWSIARAHDAFVLDLWGMRSLRDRRVWSEDRIHLRPEGHRRVAQGALVALGLVPDDGLWDVPLSGAEPLPWRRRASEDARWAREHLLPWATRRLRARSSGDDRAPKDDRPRPVPPSAP